MRGQFSAVKWGHIVRNIQFNCSFNANIKSFLFNGILGIVGSMQLVVS